MLAIGRRPLSIAVVSWVLATCVSAEESGGGPMATQKIQDTSRIERIERFEALDGAREVTLRNAFGNIRARFGGYGDDIELRAVVQHFADEGPPLEIVTERGEGRLELTVGFRDGKLVTERRPGELKRADLVLFVPEAVDTLSTETAAGLTELKGLKSNIDARSESGEIVARKIDGDLNLTSRSGHVLAVPKTRSGQTTQHLKSGGEVTIYLFDDSNVTLAGESLGRVSTDFSLDMHEAGKKKLVSFELGKGTTPIRAEAGQHLRLVRKPSAARALARRGMLEGEDRGSNVAVHGGTEIPAEAIEGDGHQDVEAHAVAGEEQQIATITGDITLWVDDGSFTIQAATSGEITVDFPIDIEYRYHQEPSKEGLITIGYDAAKLDITAPDAKEPGLTEPGFTKPGLTEPGLTEPGATVIRLESRRGAIRILRSP